MGERYTGTQNQRFDAIPGPFLIGQNRGARTLRGRARRFVVIPRIDLRTARLQRHDGRRAGTRQPEDADVAIRERASGDHGYLSFNVERPTSASTTAMIQKRITMVGSFQPSCSK